MRNILATIFIYLISCIVYLTCGFNVAVIALLALIAAHIAMINDKLKQ